MFQSHETDVSEAGAGVAEDQEGREGEAGKGRAGKGRVVFQGQAVFRCRAVFQDLEAVF